MTDRSAAGDHDVAVDFGQIEEAAARLRGVAHRTPVGTSTAFDREAGVQAFFKCEPFQRTGSFKFRGAFNACSRLGSVPGVLTFSSGNHAQAVALACRLHDLPSVVVMPTDAPAVKRSATEGYGAEIIPYDRTDATREAVAERVRSERDLTLIPPYDHPDVIAGQGTVALEFIDDVPDLDLLVVPCGGGGLLSGTAVAVRTLLPSCRIIGVEPAAADDATRSFQTGVLQRVENPQTIADGARTPSLGRFTFPIVRTLVDDMVTVDDDVLVQTMRFLWERMKIIVEPTGALGAAAVLSNVVRAEGRRVGIILSGGNVDLDGLAQLWR